MAASYLDSLPQDCAPATIHFERMVLGVHSVIAMKLALGDQDIVWLADAQDLDVWIAIDLWKQMAVVPIVLGAEQRGEWVYRFYLPETLGDVLRVDEPLDEGDIWIATEPRKSIAAYIESHGSAYPFLSARVPPVPRPDNVRGVQYLLSPAEIAAG